jgi:hypothetical protein
MDIIQNPANTGSFLGDINYCSQCVPLPHSKAKVFMEVNIYL